MDYPFANYIPNIQDPCFWTKCFFFGYFISDVFTHIRKSKKMIIPSTIFDICKTVSILITYCTQYNISFLSKCNVICLSYYLLSLVLAVQCSVSSTSVSNSSGRTVNNKTSALDWYQQNRGKHIFIVTQIQTFVFNIK